jgi:hypothetical protein
MDHEQIQAGIDVEEAGMALDTGRSEAARRMARGQEDPRIVRKAREHLQACEDRYETIQAAKAELQREAPTSRLLCITHQLFWYYLRSMTSSCGNILY